MNSPIRRQSAGILRTLYSGPVIQLPKINSATTSNMAIRAAFTTII